MDVPDRRHPSASTRLGARWTDGGLRRRVQVARSSGLGCQWCGAADAESEHAIRPVRERDTAVASGPEDTSFPVRGAELLERLDLLDAALLVLAGNARAELAARRVAVRRLGVDDAENGLASHYPALRCGAFLANCLFALVDRLADAIPPRGGRLVLRDARRDRRAERRKLRHDSVVAK